MGALCPSSRWLFCLFFGGVENFSFWGLLGIGMAGERFGPSGGKGGGGKKPSFLFGGQRVFFGGYLGFLFKRGKFFKNFLQFFSWGKTKKEYFFFLKVMEGEKISPFFRGGFMDF